MQNINKLPYVSVIIPCRNEEKYIVECLESILANDYPQDRLEILIIDGESEDATKAILEKYTQNYPFVKIFENTKKITPAGLNIGIRNAKGEIIVRMDAHCTYDKRYISICIEHLNEYNVDNVGGIWIILPRNDSLTAKAIVFALSDTFGAGNAYYKTVRTKERKWVDTVPFGCYRRSIFERIGFFNESFPRNEDIELNNRIRKAGGRILLVPEIRVNYYARTNYKEFVKHNFDNGVKITHPLKLNNMFFSFRHLIPFVFVTSLIGLFSLWMLSGSFFLDSLWSWLFLLIFGFYFLISLFVSCKITINKNDPRYLILMPIMFFTLHFTYGLGSIWGVLKTVGSKRFWHNLWD
ncbi:glycosyltransferase family 2 protein [Bacteroidota bacterium]